ncbi:MAG TPA: enoyl-CoA hydratase/isomerase family protein, partial [Kocuria sp.]|nr:enoyl-CoA hydratase/isomerase family protein [Kocuria sp.]
VRAMVVDKDKSPQWEPATAAEVDEDRIRALVSEKSELPIRI